MLWWSDSFTLAACIAAFMESTVADWQWLTVSRASFVWCQAQRQFDTGCMDHCFYARYSDRLTVATCITAFMPGTVTAWQWLHVSHVMLSLFIILCLAQWHSLTVAILCVSVYKYIKITLFPSPYARHSDKAWWLLHHVDGSLLSLLGTVTQLDNGYACGSLLSCEALSSDGLKVATSVPASMYCLWQTRWRFDRGSVDRCFHCSLTVTESLLSWQGQWHLDSGYMGLLLAVQTQWWLDSSKQGLYFCCRVSVFVLRTDFIGYMCLPLANQTQWRLDRQFKARLVFLLHSISVCPQNRFYMSQCRLRLTWSVAKNWKYCNFCKIYIFFKCTLICIWV